MGREKIQKNKIDNVVQEALGFVKSYCRIIGKKHGWHQFLGSNKVGIVATAQALLCFHYFQEDFSEKQHAIATIKQAQFLGKGDETLDGGWAYVTNASIFPTTECTAWVLLLLLEEGINARECLDKGIAWLLANHPTDVKNDLGWGSTKFDNEPRVYATALALRVLARGKYTTTNQFIKAKNWLIMVRNEEDGGWGEKRGSPSTFLHTAHALITLRECGIDPHSEILSEGCDWLLKMYDPENLWNDLQRGGLVEHVNIDAPPGIVPSTQRVTYFHFTTPWVINALIVCGKINVIQVFRGINWIVENCHNGYWNHPYLLSIKNKPMWAIHDSLLALKNFQATFPQWNEIKQVILKDGEITIKPISKARISITQYFKRFLKSKITRCCFSVILVVFLLIAFGILPIREGILGILVPFLIAIVANLVTKGSKK